MSAYCLENLYQHAKALKLVKSCDSEEIAIKICRNNKNTQFGPRERRKTSIDQIHTTLLLKARCAAGMTACSGDTPRPTLLAMLQLVRRPFSLQIHREWMTKFSKDGEMSAVSVLSVERKLEQDKEVDDNLGSSLHPPPLPLLL